MSNKKKFLLICLILCFIISIQSINAVEIDTAKNIENETNIMYLSQENQEILEISNDDDVVGDKYGDGGTFTDLKNLLNSATDGETIYLRGDYKFVEGSDDGYNDFFAHQSYGKTITLDGQG